MREKTNGWSQWVGGLGRKAAALILSSLMVASELISAMPGTRAFASGSFTYDIQVKDSEGATKSLLLSGDLASATLVSVYYGQTIGEGDVKFLQNEGTGFKDLEYLVLAGPVAKPKLEIWDALDLSSAWKLKPVNGQNSNRYYIGYSVSIINDEGGAEGRADSSGQFGVQVLKDTFAKATGLSFDGYVAKWGAVTTTTHGYPIDTAVAPVSYLVTLYKDGAEVEHQTVTTTQYDFETTMKKSYGSYTFSVKTVTTEAGKGYYNESASASSEAFAPDTFLPQIISYEADGHTGLTAKVKDAEEGIKAYLFTTLTSAPAKDSTDWTLLETPSAKGETVTLNYTLTSGGVYYLYVMDKSGNITKSANSLETTKVVYADYYIGGALTVLNEYIIGTTALNLKTVLTNAHPGYIFRGWYLGEDFQDKDKVTSLSTHAESHTMNVYGKWEAEGLVVAITTDGTFSGTGNALACTYTAADHVLTAALSTTTGLTPTYAWYYKADSSVADADATLLTSENGKVKIKNVAESGIYYAVATVTIDGTPKTVKSTEYTVTVNKAGLTVTAKPHSISFNSNASNAGVTYTGFLGSDSETSGAVTGDLSFTYTTNVDEDAEAYVKGSPEGFYRIIPSGLSSANYTITYQHGILSVGQKDVSKEGSNVTVAFKAGTDTFYFNNKALEPELLIEDADTDALTIPAENIKSVVYADNVNAGTAKVTVTFQGNYTGVIEKTFTIAPVTMNIPSETFTLEDWIYGDEANEPSVKAYYGDGDEVSEAFYEDYIYFSYRKKGTTSWSSTVPTDAGTYQARARIYNDSNGNYLYTECIIEFKITKRPLVITTEGKSWEFDGNEHTMSGYTIGGKGFAGTDGFLSAGTTGKIRNIGTAKNGFVYEWMTATNPDNYDLTITEGTLEVTKSKLPSPVKAQLSPEGRASWIAVTRANLEVTYKVSLYRVGTTDPIKTYETTVSEIAAEVAAGKDCMKADIIADCVTNNEAGAYYFTVQAIPSGGSDVGNYEKSDVSDPCATVATVQLKLEVMKGLTAVLDGKTATFETDQDMILFAGADLLLTASKETGYAFRDPVWTITGDTDSVLVLVNPSSNETHLQIPSSLSAPLNGIVLKANSGNEPPKIDGFSAAYSEGHTDDKQSVTYRLLASDSSDIIAYLFSASDTAPDKDSELWTRLKSEQTSLDVTFTVDLTNVADFSTCYAYVMDGSGSIVRSQQSIGVYQVDFLAGSDKATGSQATVLKIQNQSIKLASCGFSIEGKNFKNWTGNANGAVYFDGGTYDSNASDTLVASWSDQTFTYTVRYHFMETDGTYKAADKPDITAYYTAVYGTVVTESSVLQQAPAGFELDTSAGYTFTCTITSADANGKKNVFDIYYKRHAVSVTFTYTKPDGTKVVLPEGDKTQLYGADFVEAPAPSLPGYTFVGWDYSALGKKPATVPNSAVNATGYFEALPTTYEVRYYILSLDPTGGKYYYEDKGDSYKDVVATTHATELSFDEDGQSRISKSVYSFEGIITSNTALSASIAEDDSVLDALSDSANVTADATKKLYVYYFFDYKPYPIVLDIKVDDEIVHTYDLDWDYRPGYDLTETMTGSDKSIIDYILTYDQDNWFDYAETYLNGIGIDPLSYELSSTVDYSTGERPAKMQMGTLHIVQTYTKKNEAPPKFRLQIMYETATVDQFALQAEMDIESYFDEVVTAGPDSSYTFNWSATEFRRGLSNIGNYEVDTTRGMGAPDWSFTMPSRDDYDEANLPVVILYYKRIKVVSTINYYVRTYDEDGKEQDILFYTIKKKYRVWDSTNAEVFALFGQATDGATKTNYAWIGESEIISKEAQDVMGFTLRGSDGNDYSPLDFNFCTNKYAVGYLVSTYSVLKSDSDPARTNIMLSNGNTMNIYFFDPQDENKPETEYTYFDVKYYWNNNIKYASDADKALTQLVYNYGGTDYLVRVACEEYFKASSLSADESKYPNYPGAAYITENLIKSEPTLKPQFTEVTIPGKSGKYYTETSGGQNYIYQQIDTKTKVGERVYYYADVNVIGSEGLSAKAAQYETDYLKTDATLGYTSIIIDNPGFNAKMAKTGNTITLRLRYSDYTVLYHTYNGATCAGHAFKRNSEIAYDDYCTCSYGLEEFQDHDGFALAWHTGKAVTVITTPIKTGNNGSIVLIGSLVRATVYDTEYAYYQLPTPIQVPGESGTRDYLTEADIDPDTADEDFLDRIVAVDEKSEDVSFVDGSGVTKKIKVTYTHYYYTYDNGSQKLFMITASRPTLTFEEVEFKYNVSPYVKSGYTYAKENTGNITNRTVGDTGVRLVAYFTANGHTLTIVDGTNDADPSQANPQTYNTNQDVLVSEPSRIGYNFTGWTYTKTGTSTAVSAADMAETAALDGGAVTVTMPDYDVTMTANWEARQFTQSVTHYFQIYDESGNLAFKKALVNSLLGETGTDVSVSYNDTDYEGTLLVGLDPEEGAYTGCILITIDGTDYYFARSEEEDDVYTVEETDLVGAVSYVTLLQDASEKKVKDLLISSGIYEFDHLTRTYLGTGKSLKKDDAIPAKGGMTLEIYYERSVNQVLTLDKAATDGGEIPATMYGDGSYCYDAQVEIDASLPEGFTFVGWYNGTTLVSTSRSYQFQITGTMTLTATYEAKAVLPGPPTMSVSGNTSYIYKYALDSGNEMQLSLTLPDGTDDACYISGYQWYEMTGDTPDTKNDTKITGANSAVYMFPTGKDVGTYNYYCEVEFSRSDNKRWKVFNSPVKTITVSPSTFVVETTKYLGIYDGKAHTIEVSVGGDALASDYVIYYSASSLGADEANWLAAVTAGTASATAPTFTHVPEAADDTATVYYMVYNADGCYESAFGSETVTIHPATLKIVSTVDLYEKVYDGGTALYDPDEKGAVELLQDYINILGLMEGETVYVKFDAEYNSRHVLKANRLDLSNVAFFTDEACTSPVTDYKAESSDVAISAKITALPITITAFDSTEFTYDSEAHAPAVSTYESSTGTTPEEISFEVTGEKINANTNYTALVKVVCPAVDDFDAGDYALSSDTVTFTIKKRPITVNAVDATYTYNGFSHTLNSVEVSEGTLVTGDSFSAVADSYYTNAGVYNTVGLKKLAITRTVKEGEATKTTDVMDNYDVTVAKAKLTIEQREVIFQGLTVNSKVYDGTTNVASSAIVLTNVEFTNKALSTDDISLVVSDSSASYASAAAGKDIAVTLDYDNLSLGGEDKDNYKLVKKTTSGGKEVTGQTGTHADITSYGKITITATADSEMTYGTAYSADGVNADVTAGASVFLEGEDISSLSGTVAFTLNSKADGTGDTYQAGSGVGTYYLIPSGLSSPNYEITFVPCEIQVVPKQLTITANEVTKSKVYDNSTTVIGTAADLVSTDYVIDSTSAFGTDKVGLKSYTAVYDYKDVETATKITITDIVFDNANYEPVSDTMTFTATISKKDLTITAKPKTITYGDSAANDGLSYSGFAKDESITSTGFTGSASYAYNSAEDGTGDAYASTSNAGTYYIIPSGFSNPNYNITYAAGKLTVNKKSLTVKAVAKSMTYGDTLPELSYTCDASQFVNGDTWATAVTGDVTYTGTATSVTQTTAAGTYSYKPVVSGLSATNYSFTAGSNVNFVISKKSVTISGLTVDGKVYDATLTVPVENILTDDAVIDGLTTWDSSTYTISDVTLTGTYADKDAAMGKNVTVTMALKGEFAKRYELSSTELSTTSFISQHGLDVTAVAVTNVKYGTITASYPSFSVTYDGLQGSDKAADVVGTLTYTVKQGDTVVSPISASTEVGTYSVYPSGNPSSVNYKIVYKPNTMTVVKNTLATPAPSWSTTSAGVITWKAIPAVGSVNAKEYILKVYKDGAQIEDLDGAGSTTITVPADGSTTYTYNLLSLIRGNGAGAYTVSIYAVSDEETEKNVSTNSAAGTSGSTYAVLVKAVCESAVSSHTLKNPDFTATVNSVEAVTTGAVLVQGESLVGFTVATGNTTGYTISSIKSSSTCLSITKGDLGKETLSGTVALSGLTSASPITLTVGLKPVAATISVALSESDSILSATYGYAGTARPKITVSATPTSADNVDAAGYDYTYQWYFRDDSKKKFEKAGTLYPTIADNEATWMFPIGMSAATNRYTAICNVTATRKDNGLSTTYEMDDVITVNVLRGDKDYKLINVTGWTFGSTRQTLSISNVADLNNDPLNEDPQPTVTFHYYLGANEVVDGSGNPMQPWQAGTYTVYAHIGASTNFNETDTEAVEFTISKATMAKPDSATFTIDPLSGDISWTGVGSFYAPSSTDVSSKAVPLYRVRIYKDGSLVETLADQTATTANIKSYWAKYGAGEYHYTVETIPENQDKNGVKTLEDNALASGESGVSDSIKTLAIAAADATYEKTYGEGNTKYQIILTPSLTVGADQTCQWYCDGVAISGANDASFAVTHVSQSGEYQLVISKEGGDTLYSNLVECTINPVDLKDATITIGDPLTYNGLTQTRDFKVSIVVGDKEYTTTDPLLSTGNYVITGNEQKNANTASGATKYKLTITAQTGSDYTGSKDAEWTIGMKALTITAKPKTITYGNAAANDGLDYSGFENSETASVLSGSASYAYNTSSDGTGTAYAVTSPVGSYYIIPSGLTSTNYDITFKTGTMTVEQREIGITWNPTAWTFVYNGKDKVTTEINPVPTNVANSDTINLTLKITQGTDELTEAVIPGKYLLTVTAQDNSNYKLPSTLPSKEFTISNAAITDISCAQTGSLTYDGNDLTATYSFNATTKGSQTAGITFSTTKDGTYSSTMPTFRTAGDHTVYYKIAAQYHDTSAPKTFTVTIGAKAVSDSSITVASVEDKTYTGSAITPTPAVTDTARSATLLKDTDYTLSYSANVEVGTVTITVTGKGNYQGTNTSCTFKIVPKEVGIVWPTTTTFTFNRQSHNVTPTLSGIIGTDEVTFTITNDVKTDVGSYTANVTGLTGAKAKNYKLPSSTSKDWKIDPESIAEGTITLTNSLTYSGSAQTQTFTLALNKDSDKPTLVLDTDFYVDNASATKTDAGTYTLTLKGKNNYTGEVSIEFAIAKKTLTIVWPTTVSFEYDGANHTVAPTLNGIETVGTVKDDVSATLSNDTKKDAGDYTTSITGITGTRADNYKLPTTGLTQDWSITKRVLSVTWPTTLTFTYTKTAHSVFPTIGRVVTGEEVNLTVTDYEKTAKGSYTALVTGITGSSIKNYQLPATGLSQDWSIGEKAISDSTITVEAITPVTYSKTEYKPVLTVKDGDTLLVLGTDYTVTYPTDCTNAGTKSITVTGIGNYKSTRTVNYTIYKKALTITANPKTIVYGDAAANDGLDYSGFVGGETASVLSGSAAYAYNTSSDGTGTAYAVTSPVGSYYIIPSGLTSSNYDITFKTGTMTVEQREIGVNWTPAAWTFTYNGKDKVATEIKASASNVVNGDKVNLTLKLTQGTDELTEAVLPGKYLLTVTAQDNSNYRLPATLPTKEFTIGNATITDISCAQTGTLTYNGTDLTATYSFNATTKGSQTASITFSTTKDGTYSSTMPTFRTAGDHTVYYKIAAQYHNTSDPKTFTVTIGAKAITDASISIESVADQTYTAAAITPTPTITDTARSAELLKDTDYTLSYSANVEVGTVTITVTGIGNYKGTNTSRTFKIVPKEVGIVWPTTTTFTYNRQSHNVTPTLSGIIGTDEVTFTITNDVKTDAGSYTANVTGLNGAKAKNYKLPSSTSKEWKINPESIAEGTITLTNTLTYNGSAQTQTFTLALNKDSDKPTLVLDTDFYVDNASATKTDAGTYTLKLKGKNNYTGEITIDFTIAKKTLTIVWPTTVSFEYDGTNHTVAPTLNGIETVGTVKDDVSATLSNDTKKDSGDYTTSITGITGTRADNYKLPTTGLTQDWSITKRVLSVTWPTTLTFTYTKAAHSVFPTIGRVVTGENVNLTVTGYLQTAKGSYTAQVTGITGTSIKNYVLPSTGLSQDWTIGEKAISDSTVTVEAITPVTYSNTAYKPVLTVKDGDTVLKLDTDYTVTYPTDCTTAGTKTITIYGIGNYKESRTVDYTIEQKTVTVTWPTATEPTYNTKELNVTPTLTGICDGDTITLIVTGDKQTAAGTYKATVTGLNGEKKANYKLPTNTELNWKIKPASIDGQTLTLTKSLTYTGLSQKQTIELALFEKAGVPVKLAEGTDYTVKTVGTGAEEKSSDLGLDAGKYTLTIEGTGNYTGTASVEFTVAKKVLTIVTDASTKTYDGDPLTADGRITGLQNNEKLTFTVTGSQTAVGNSDNTYTITFDQTAKASNYDIESDVTVGKLTVNEYAGEITVTVTGGSFTYDGQAHKADLQISTLPAGYTLITMESNASVTHVADGTKTAKVDTLVIKNKQGIDVTDKLNITKGSASISVTKATLTVNMPSSSKTYDGDPLTSEGSINGFVNGETATFKTTGSQTATGSSKNTYSITWDKTAASTDYTINETIGTLSVSENMSEITITVNGGTYTYDGQAHGATVEVSTLPTGYTLIKATASATVTHVSDGTKTAKCDTLIIRNKQGIDVTDNLNLKFNDSTIKISPRTITVNWKNLELTYNGKPQLPTAEIGNAVTGENLSLTVSGEKTDANATGENYTATAAAEVKRDGVVTTDYIFEATAGTTPFTIKPATLTIVTPDDEKTYDGTPLTKEGKINGLQNGETVSFETTGTITAFGTAENTYTLAFDKTAKSSNYTIGTVTVGTLSIKKKSVDDITVNFSGDIIYDGAPHKQTIDSVTVVSNGKTLTLVEGTDYELVISEETDAGTYTLTINGIGNFSGTVLKNWTISPKVLEIDWGAAEFSYNGKAQIPTFEFTNLCGTDECAYTLTGEGVHAGSYTAALIAIENSNYALPEDETVSLDFVIRPIPLQVSTESATRVYDGTALTAGGIITGLLAGEKAHLEITGTQTDAGESKNSGRLVFDHALASDYTVTTAFGTLTVLPKDLKDVEVTLKDTLTYNGEEQTEGILSVKAKENGNELLLQNGTDYTVTGNKGTSADTYQMTLTGTGNYTGTKTVSWKISIAKNEIFSVTIEGWTTGRYDETINAPHATAIYGTPVFTYGLAGSDELSAELPTEPGVYKVRATVPATNDYSEFYAECIFVIRPVELWRGEKDAEEYAEGSDGYWGDVYNELGLPYGGKLIIDPADPNFFGCFAIYRNIRDTGDGYRYYGSSVSSLKGKYGDELKPLLTWRSIMETYDIGFLVDNVWITEFNGVYTVKILLPENLRFATNLQMVYIDKDNRIEFFDTTREGNYVVFKTDHFSNFVLLGVTFPWWILIVIAVIIILIVILIIVKKKKDKEKKAEEEKKAALAAETK